MGNNLKLSHKGDPVFLTILICILVTVTAGSLINYYFSNAQEQENQGLEDQVAKLDQQVKTLQSGGKIETITTSSVAKPVKKSETADWKTYENKTFGFSFEYPPGWPIAEKAESQGDARKFLISLNLTGAQLTADSITVEVFNSSNKTALQFVNSWYKAIESGPSSTKEVRISNLPAIRFFMEKSSANSQGGSANILFQNGSNLVALSTGPKVGSVSDILNDKVLGEIASTFKFKGTILNTDIRKINLNTLVNKQALEEVNTDSVKYVDLNTDNKEEVIFLVDSTGSMGNSAVVVYKYNKGKAKRLLEETGYSHYGYELDRSLIKITAINPNSDVNVQLSYADQVTDVGKTFRWMGNKFAQVK